MAKDLLGYWDYVKAAFHWKVDIPWLGKMPLNKVMLAGLVILGFVNPGFWLLGAAAEAGFLLLVAGNDRFQNLVKATRLQASAENWAERQAAMLAALDGGSQERYRRLLETGAAVLHSSGPLADRDAAGDLRAGSLNQLHWMFLKLLVSQGRIRDILAQTSKKDLEREIDDLTQRLAKEDPASAVARSVQGTLDIQKRRLGNILQAESSLQVIEAELDRIEKHVTLLREEALVTRDPAQLSDRLDGVMESLQGTSKWMAENNELFGSLEEVGMPPTLIDRALRDKEQE